MIETSGMIEFDLIGRNLSESDLMLSSTRYDRDGWYSFHLSVMPLKSSD